MKNVLFLCTANSARSILAEAILNAEGPPRFRGHSAGSTPRGIPNPVALNTLTARGHDITGLHSKSWDAFAGPDAPQMDLILTLCDSAAAETCPFWPGHPASAHWGLADPAGQPDEPAAFNAAYDLIRTRVRALMALPDDLAPDALRTELRRIGTLT
jgi:protein-tyrosine-phosphatase